TQEFYSVGLVLVPLTANMLWKPAVHRGLMQLVVEVGVTYLVVAFILLPYTNLSLSSVELTYENTAINFVAHAKAHIILLSAALLAAQFNLTYGWDFNGIMVPALLALLWLTPLKLVATLIEAVAVLYMVRGFLKLPVIQHMDFEGPRKIVLVFTMAFVWKMLLGFSLAPIFPELKISDTYGFGYLLSSLLAVKMLGKKSVRAVMLPTLVASSGGFVIGSVIGFVLELLSPGVPEARAMAAVDSHRLSRTPVGTMTLARMRAGSWGEEPALPTQAELQHLHQFWADAAAWIEQPPERPTVADLDGNPFASALALRVWSLGMVPVGRVPQLGSFDQRSEREWFAVIEQGEGGLRGWPTAILAPGAEGPVLVVPAPYSEAPTAEAAAVVCRAIDCRAVLVAGREQALPGTSVAPRPIEKAMEVFSEVPMIVLRVDEGAAVADVETLRSCVDGFDDLSTGTCATPEAARATIHPLRGAFSIGAPWPSYQLDWEPLETVVRLPPGDALFAIMRVSAAALEARVVVGIDEFAVADAAVVEEVAPRLGVDELVTELARMHENREPPGMGGAGYLAPSPAELRVLEELVVEPLLAWAESPRHAEAPPPEIGVWASLLDYELVELGRCGVDDAKVDD
ncbi:MAG: hypothetical protein KC431_20090, partial [Myxococcales bacterium]|nr:hypothetical protein [Myxococcales bacterium]